MADESATNPTNRVAEFELPMDTPVRQADIDAFLKETFPQVTGTDVIECEPAVLEICYSAEQDMDETIFAAIIERFFPDEDFDP